MPSSRPRRPRHPVSNALSPGLMDILLTGDCPDDGFLIFEVDIRDGGQYLPRLFRENRAAVLAEWKRRKGKSTGKPWILRPSRSPLHLVNGRWVSCSWRELRDERRAKR